MNKTEIKKLSREDANKLLTEKLKELEINIKEVTDIADIHGLVFEFNGIDSYPNIYGYIGATAKVEANEDGYLVVDGKETEMAANEEDGEIAKGWISSGSWC